MKGLLLKDYYTITKQIRIYLLILVIFAFLPGFPAFLFAIVYSSMLPITAIAYDEHSKWNRMAEMMPYSETELVLSKYVLGYIAVVLIWILSIVVQTVLELIAGIKGDSLTDPQYITLICVALGFEAVILPLMFKLGVEKGRIILIALAGGVTFCISFFGGKLSSIKALEADPAGVMIISTAAAIIMNVLSVLLSVHLYKSVKK